MVASIFATSGTIVSMSTTTTAPATYDAAGYGALTYQALGCLSHIGSFGDTSAEVTFDCINEGRTITIKGQRSAGTLELTVALDDTAAGFALIDTAERDDSTANYHFKIEFPNKQNATGTNAVRYFSGRVMSAPENLGGANDVATQTVNVAINTPIVKVASTAGV